MTSDPDGVRPEPPVAEHHHRDVRGGAARAAVFGVSDGLVSNVGLILGVANTAQDAECDYPATRAGPNPIATGSLISIRF